MGDIGAGRVATAWGARDKPRCLVGQGRCVGGTDGGINVRGVANFTFSPQAEEVMGPNKTNHHTGGGTWEALVCCQVDTTPPFTSCLSGHMYSSQGQSRYKEGEGTV